MIEDWLWFLQKDQYKYYHQSKNPGSKSPVVWPKDWLIRRVLKIIIVESEENKWKSSRSCWYQSVATEIYEEEANEIYGACLHKKKVENTLRKMWKIEGRQHKGRRRLNCLESTYKMCHK